MKKVVVLGFVGALVFAGSASGALTNYCQVFEGAPNCGGIADVTRDKQVWRSLDPATTDTTVRADGELLFESGEECVTGEVIRAFPVKIRVNTCVPRVGFRTMLGYDGPSPRLQIEATN